MLDGKRLDALMKVGEHKGIEDLVVVRYRLQRFDESADYLRLKQGNECHVLRCMNFQEVKVCEKLFWALRGHEPYTSGTLICEASQNLLGRLLLDTSTSLPIRLTLSILYRLAFYACLAVICRTTPEVAFRCASVLRSSRLSFSPSHQSGSRRNLRSSHVPEEPVANVTPAWPAESENRATSRSLSTFFMIPYFRCLGSKTHLMWRAGYGKPCFLGILTFFSTLD